MCQIKMQSTNSKSFIYVRESLDPYCEGLTSNLAHAVITFILLDARPDDDAA